MYGPLEGEEIAAEVRKLCTGQAGGSSGMKITTTVTWISEETWTLADQRTSLVRNITENQQERMTATRRFHAALREDRRFKVRKSGEEIKSLVENDQMQEAWNKIQRWY